MPPRGAKDGNGKTPYVSIEHVEMRKSVSGVIPHNRYRLAVDDRFVLSHECGHQTALGHEPNTEPFKE